MFFSKPCRFVLFFASYLLSANAGHARLADINNNATTTRNLNKSSSTNPLDPSFIFTVFQRVYV